MSSSRMNKVNETMLRELTTLIRTVKDPRVSGIVSVVHVEVAPDMRTAKAYVSVLGGNGPEVIKGLRSAAGYLGRELGQKIRLHHTPKLEFELDTSIAHGAHINKIILGLNIPEDGEPLTGGADGSGDDEP